VALDPTTLQKAIRDAGHTWHVRIQPPGERHGLGRLPADPQKKQVAINIAHQILSARIRVVPPPGPETQAIGPAAGRIKDLATTGSVAAAVASLPAEMDWRTRGIIGPVEDQGWCGSCVSFCTTGLVAAMAWLELGLRDLTLSAADQHFCSSHGPNCGGWNEHDALDQIKTRGVVPEEAFPYMSAFDNPPKGDPNDNPDHPPTRSTTLEVFSCLLFAPSWRASRLV
jgi:hypothetical protein